MCFSRSPVRESLVDPKHVTVCPAGFETTDGGDLDPVHEEQPKHFCIFETQPRQTQLTKAMSGSSCSDQLSHRAVSERSHKACGSWRCCDSGVVPFGSNFSRPNAADCTTAGAYLQVDLALQSPCPGSTSGLNLDSSKCERRRPDLRRRGDLGSGKGSASVDKREGPPGQLQRGRSILAGSPSCSDRERCPEPLAEISPGG